MSNTSNGRGRIGWQGHVLVLVTIEKQFRDSKLKDVHLDIPAPSTRSEAAPPAPDQDSLQARKPTISTKLRILFLSTRAAKTVT